MKRIAIWFFFTAAAIGACAQTVEQVKNNKQYYWGEGVGKTTAQADKEAMAMLIGSISTTVESRFSVQSSEEMRDGRAQHNQYVHSLVQTYSSAAVKNTEILSWGEEPDVHVFRFVKRTEVYKIFADRENKIKEFVAIASRADAQWQVADALRYYYWALLLLQSHPDATEMTADLNGASRKLDVYIPERINALLDNLSVTVTGKQIDGNLTHYLLEIRYRDHPAVNCDYAFFDGRNWSETIAAKDGKGIAEMTGDNSLHKNLRIKIEYAFENEWRIDKEIDDVLRKIEPVIFKKSYMDVALEPSAPSPSLMPSPALESLQELKPLPRQELDNTPYISMLMRVENAIRSRRYDSVRDCFTDEGYEIFIRLVQYGKALIIAQPDYQFVAFEDGIMARSLPMRFSFSNNRKQFVENVVFHIAKDSGKIRSLSFALSDNVCNEIAQHDQWGTYSRIAIIHFIETYKTAYALKRLDFIESIFSENALIIVGKVVKNYTGPDQPFIPNSVRLTQYKKEQYIRQLATVFRSNEYVNLHFTDISVKQAGAGGEIYGIQLKQDYFSTSYGDTGYLFLMVDLNKTDEPLIHIRTWQPEKDPDFGLYDISYF
ncbi:MAG: hypothetical protein LBS12_03460 [Prevotellaceae bacterium]|jgi:hypothetical protein|nr:hypothetical protein [Prevotellaceae bacterium]